jgi:hypothetical protein
VADATSTITITSQADTTKSCSFDVTIKDIYFNRKYSEIGGGDEMENELPADGGIVKTTGGASDMLIINKPASTHFMVTTTIQVNSVTEGELWPKFGLVFKQVDENEDLTSDFLITFLDAPMNRVTDGHASWTDFGYCEIAGGVFGWDTTHAYARHKENVFIKKTGIDYNEDFTMSAVVDGRKIHMFLGYGEGEAAKEVYMYTVEGYEDLFGTGKGRGFIPGFFNFKSVATFKNYSYSTDETAIAAKMNDVVERLADYAGPDHPGTSYNEE